MPTEDKGDGVGIKCPHCGKQGSKVRSAAQHAGYSFRRRQCNSCDKRWTTEERTTGAGLDMSMRARGPLMED